MKKFASALLVSAASLTAAYADTPSATGFYVGANVGLANTNVKYNYNTGNLYQVTGSSVVTPATLNVGKAQGGSLNPLFGLFVGYGRQINHFYIGAEIYGGIDSAKVTPFDQSGSGTGEQTFGKETVKRTSFYGLSILPGYFVTPTTKLFVRLGVEGGSWKAKSDLSAMTPSGSAAQLAAFQATAITQKSKSTISFVPGLGVDLFATKNVFVRLEYKYVFGPSITFSQNIDGTNVTGTSLTNKFKISQNVFNIGVGYKF
jgi:opacity protein-like surface antigen